jgi:hypothetical protein
VFKYLVAKEKIELEFQNIEERQRRNSDIASPVPFTQKTSPASTETSDKIDPLMAF